MLAVDIGTSEGEAMDRIQYLPDWAGITAPPEPNLRTSKPLAEWTAQPAGSTMVLERPVTQTTGQHSIHVAPSEAKLIRHQSTKGQLSSVISWIIVASICAAFGVFVAQLVP